MPWSFYDKLGNLKNSSGGTEVAYAESTASVTATATTEATANTVVTAPAFTADGTSSYLVEYFCPQYQTGGGGATMNIALYDGASSIGILGQAGNGAAGNVTEAVRLSRKVTPSAGSKTYSIRIYSSGGSGTAAGGAGGVGNFMPQFIRVTRV